MKIYSKKEIRDIIIAFSVFGAILAVGYFTKHPSPREEANHSDKKVLANSTLLIKAIPPCR